MPTIRHNLQRIKAPADDDLLLSLFGHVLRPAAPPQKTYLKPTYLYLMNSKGADKKSGLNHVTMLGGRTNYEVSSVITVRGSVFLYSPDRVYLVCNVVPSTDDYSPRFSRKWDFAVPYVHVQDLRYGLMAAKHMHLGTQIRARECCRLVFDCRAYVSP